VKVMKSSEKIALALDIIPYLVDHNGITREEAAHHFGITPRELTSILETAVCCGVPGYYGGILSILISGAITSTFTPRKG